LITGSGRGIGRSMRSSSQARRPIVVNDLDMEPAQETVSAIRAVGGVAIACVGNVTAPDFADRFINAAVNEYKASISSSTTPAILDT